MHTRGSQNITGSFWIPAAIEIADWNSNRIFATGPASEHFGYVLNTSSDPNSPSNKLYFDASKNWTGEKN